MRQSMQFYCLNMFWAPICPSSGVQLINNFCFYVAIPGKPPGLCGAGLLVVSTAGLCSAGLLGLSTAIKLHTFSHLVGSLPSLVSSV
jgi:hypothetical protein